MAPIKKGYNSEMRALLTPEQKAVVDEIHKSLLRRDRQTLYHEGYQRVMVRRGTINDTRDWIEICGDGSFLIRKKNPWPSN